MTVRNDLPPFNYEPAPPDDGVKKVYKENYIDNAGNVYTGELNEQN